GAYFWPLGYPLLLAGGFALFGVSAATAQAISLILGALLASLCYVLARLVGASTVGAFVAGAVVVICGQAIQSSIVVMSDIPALTWATASAVALWAYRLRRRSGWLMAAAVLLAL